MDPPGSARYEFRPAGEHDQYRWFVARICVLESRRFVGTTACTPPETPKLNPLTNPSLERGTTDPEGWQRDVFRPMSDLTWDDDVTRSGRRSIAIHSPVPDDARWIQTVAVEPHTIYELSGWIRTGGVQHSPQALDAGANLTVVGMWVRSEALDRHERLDIPARAIQFGGESTTVTGGG